MRLGVGMGMRLGVPHECMCSNFKDGIRLIVPQVYDAPEDWLKVIWQPIELILKTSVP